MNKQKAKMKQNKILKGRKGITLIALVITIIVLLILAGVSIAMLTGDNGILTKASDSATKSKEAEEKEKISLSYSAAMVDNDGKGVTKSYFETELKKYDNGITVEQDGENFKVTYPNENVYTVKKDGTIEKATNNSGSTATAEEVNALIGQTVDYKDKSGKVNAWRVFYASNTEMFLISSNTISSSEAFGADSNGIPIKATYIKADEEQPKIVINDEYGAKYNETYNSKWYKYGMTDTRERSQATAYLCDSNNWTEYVGENAPAGTYAVGGPTKELFILSWNASIPQTEVQEVSLEDGDVTAEGYAYKKPTYLYDDDPILTTILPKTEEGTDGLYNNGSSYWLASPSSDDADYVCGVDYSGFVYYGYYSYARYGARPLVSIPMSKVQVKDGIVTIGSN